MAIFYKDWGLVAIGLAKAPGRFGRERDVKMKGGDLLRPVSVLRYAARYMHHHAMKSSGDSSSPNIYCNHI